MKFIFTPENPPDIDFWERWQYDPIPKGGLDVELSGPEIFRAKVEKQLKFVFRDEVNITHKNE